MRYLLGILLVLTTATGCSSDTSVNTEPSLRAAPSGDEVVETEPSKTIEEPLKIGGDVKAPVVIKKVSPKLPEEYLTGEYEFGVLILHAVIDRHGRVASVRAANHQDHELTPLYMNTLKEWRFKPATLHGEPVAVEFGLTVGHFPAARVR